jgi:hypothetical protein
MAEKLTNLREVYVADIANPGYGPIYAVHVRADRLYVLTNPQALSSELAYVERLAKRVRASGAIDPDLWDRAEITNQEMIDKAHDTWVWEQEEQMAGRW